LLFHITNGDENSILILLLYPNKIIAHDLEHNKEAICSDMENSNIIFNQDSSQIFVQEDITITNKFI